MRLAKWSQAETARQLRLTDSAVSQILSGKNTPSPQTLHFLRTLVIDRNKPKEGTSLILSERSNAVEVLSPEFRKLDQAPVISWASAGSGGAYMDLAGFLDEYVDTDCRDPNKYALIVDGDSMEPAFRAGDRIVLAPNEEARNGDVVVARLAENGEVLFKLFHEIGRGKIRLTSYHPAYPPIERERKEFRFIHPVYAMTRKTLKRGGQKS